MKNFIYPFCILFFFISCNTYPTDVEEALRLAGDNRVELEKVLNHFKGKDKIAYESACFLIGNMKYHKNDIER